MGRTQQIKRVFRGRIAALKDLVKLRDHPLKLSDCCQVLVVRTRKLENPCGRVFCLPGTDSGTRLRYTIVVMFCPECRAEYRPGFTRCSDCDVELVHKIPEHGTRVRKTKRDSETMSPTNNVPKLLTAFISLGWIPAGLLGLWIGEQLPRNAQLPFYVFVIVEIIYYRLAGARRLRRKWMQWSKH